MKHLHLRPVLISFCFLSVLILVASEAVWARPKKEVLMSNGDHMTCEIIRIQTGYLNVNLDFVDGTVALDWSKVSRVISPQQFVFTDQSGRRHAGTL